MYPIIIQHIQFDLPSPLNIKMATFLSFFFFFFSFILLLVGHTISADQFTCKSTSCQNGGLSIQFPFWLKSLSILNQSHHNCGYPGFELSCSNTTTTSHSFSQPLLTLPESGDYAVKLISLEDQKVWINDPNECLPERIIRNHGLNLQGSPFQLSDDYTLVNYSFLNCPSNLTSPYMIQPITCLNFTSSDYSNINYSVLAVLSDPLFPTPWISSCHLISSALIPVEDMPWMFWTDYYSDIVLQWVNPNCGSCEARGGRCGFLRDTTFDVYCYDLPGQTQGVSRKAKYGITLGLGIPGLLGIIWLTCFFCRKLNPRDQQQQRRSIEFSSMILPRTPAVVMGLDGARIERYPKTQLGESGRLPKPNDNICSICLCEYQPKEMLRTIPECNHYFHANCIDEWLKMNATCPLCRNLPERSFLISPSLPPSPTS